MTDNAGASQALIQAYLWSGGGVGLPLVIAPPWSSPWPWPG